MEGVGGSAGSSACPFLRRTSTKRSYSTMANDSRRSRSPASLFVSATEREEPPLQSRRPNDYLALPRRHMGDGLDFRRPMMSGESGSEGVNGSGNNHMVIDLTAEDDSRNTTAEAISAPDPGPVAGSSRAQRPPRFGRNIIDLDSEGEGSTDHQPATAREPTRFSPQPRAPNFFEHITNHPRFSMLRRPHRPANNHQPPANMDEIQFLEVRPRSGLESRSRTPAAQAQRSLTPYPTGFNAPIDLTGEDDDVVHLDTRARHDAGVNIAGPIGVGLGTIAVEDDDGEFGFGGFLDRNPRLRLRLDQAGGIRAQRDRLMELTHEGHRHMGINNVNWQRNDNQPLRLAVPAAVARLTVDMNYDIPGFDLGYPGAAQAQPPKYEAPEPAKEGFTRSPGEDEEVVCPNCGDELAMGDTEDKQQIWVIKKCGHAYCGDCAKNRPKKATRSTKNGKGKAPADTGPFPFKHCVVDGCKESALLKSMIRLYMAG